MILVTGATGHVGGALVAQLAAAHQPVRAMTRRPDAVNVTPAGEVVYGDPASLDAAFDGADSVYSGGGGDDAIGAWYREAEAAVMDSGIDWTMLRPGRFMSNALQWARPALRAAGPHSRPGAGHPRRRAGPGVAAGRTADRHRADGHARAGVPASVIDAIMARTLGSEGTEVLPTVAQILRRPPTTFAQWATTHAGLFTGTDRH